MVIHDMTDKECAEFLAHIGCGRLGCAFDNEPYVMPIYFAYKSDHLYSFSTTGQKIEWMRTNPKVCVEADEVTNRFLWKSVIVKGRYQELPNTPEFAAERLTAQLELEKRMLWWQTASVAAQFHAAAEPRSLLFYCIQICSITGRCAIPDAADSAFLKISV